MTRADLVKLVDQAEDEELPDLMGDLAAAQAKALARLTTPRAPAAEDDRNLSAQEASALLGVSTDWLYEHPELPFVVKIGRRTLYDKRGLQKWNRSRQRRA